MEANFVFGRSIVRMSLASVVVLNGFFSDIIALLSFLELIRGVVNLVEMLPMAGRDGGLLLGLHEN